MPTADGGHPTAHGPGRGEARVTMAPAHPHAGDHDAAPSREQRLEMLHAHHRNTLWCTWTLVLLGFWLLVAPFTFGYLNPENWARPSGGRGPWFLADGATADSTRAWLIAGSDVVSGLVLLTFAWRALRPNRPVSLWICCAVGVWITLAPVLFWSPTPAAYLSDTLAGILIIACSVLIPGMPGMILFMQHGPPTPPGWSYNPSSWPQRWIMIATGFAGFLVSRYLAAFQLGYLDRAWDPFFGSDTARVLDSDLSRAWPVSDAALGTLSYTFEFLMGFMGSPARWRTMPWMVAFFGVLVIPLGLVHILLVISQPLVVGHWCTLCLLAAAIMLPMIPLEVDEVVAMAQHLRQARRRGDRGGSLWAIFWKGGSAAGCTPDDHGPDLVEFAGSPLRVLRAALRGMSAPWTLAASAALGVWLMVQPAVLGRAGPDAATLVRSGRLALTSADVFHLGGALILTASVIAMGEVVRLLRWLSIPCAMFVAITPWFANPLQPASSAAGALAGLGVILLTIPSGPQREHYGAWDRLVR